ncbi:hypothetical protein [Pseudomonas syringae]|uniref:hypothetical protein n=1 Tax=Pseudomonas syringae TaxID=317 RepID=UPI001CA8BAE0|nr:hypothetical protein [Pseudomonas syringae]
MSIQYFRDALPLAGCEITPPSLADWQKTEVFAAASKYVLIEVFWHEPQAFRHATKLCATPVDENP